MTSMNYRLLEYYIRNEGLIKSRAWQTVKKQPE